MWKSTHPASSITFLQAEAYMVNVYVAINDCSIYVLLFYITLTGMHFYYADKRQARVGFVSLYGSP